MKQRLVGAIVLVALAVIFLPMVLDGSGRSGPREIAIEIPAQPQPPANRLESTPDLSDTDLQPPPMPTEPEAGQPAERAGQRPPADGTSSAAASEPGSGSERDSHNGATATAGGGSGESVDRPQAAATDRGEAGPTAFVVQVGSFTRETNALVLRDRLRASDFDAFAERADTGERTVWRVRVGPVATRDAADQLRERVTAERGGPALVMTHP